MLDSTRLCLVPPLRPVTPSHFLIPPPPTIMSSKRKWDQAAPELGSADSETPTKALKTEEGKTVSEAAAAAAAIAAKIAAQFSATADAAPGSIQIGQRDPHDAEFTHDIDINDIRNRYLLTKSSTQSEVCLLLQRCPCFMSVHPVRSKKTLERPSAPRACGTPTDQKRQKEIPLCTFTYLLRPNHSYKMQSTRLTSSYHWISVPLLKTRKTVCEKRYYFLHQVFPLLSSLALQRKWPEEKLPVGIDTIRNFNVRAKVVGPGVCPQLVSFSLSYAVQGMFVKYIQQETGTRVQIKGLGSGFVDQETGKESDEPMHIHITYVAVITVDSLSLPNSGPDEAQVARAKVLTEDLLEVVRIEHGKAQAAMAQQQMELHHAQIQYAQYSAMAVSTCSLCQIPADTNVESVSVNRAATVQHLHRLITHHRRHLVNNLPHLQMGAPQHWTHQTPNLQPRPMQHIGASSIHPLFPRILIVLHVSGLNTATTSTRHSSKNGQQANRRSMASTGLSRGTTLLLVLVVHPHHLHLHLLILRLPHRPHKIWCFQFLGG